MILDHKTNFKWPKSVAQCSTFDLCEYIVMSLVDCIKYLVFSLDFLVPPNESTTNILTDIDIKFKKKNNIALHR